MTAMLVIASCGGGDGGSGSGTPLESLMYPVSKIDASGEGAINDITPAIVPQDAMAEYTVSPTLPAGLELDPKSGRISGTPTDAYVAEAIYTVTARGTGGYTGVAVTSVTITTVGTLSTRIEISTITKTNPAEDKRYHYAAFTVQADGTSSLGRHKLALKLKTDSTPTVQEMSDGDGVYRIVNHIEKKVLLSYTLGSGISDLMTDTNYLEKIIKHGDQIGATATDTADVDSYLLSPGTEYTLYALKDGGDSVEALNDFTTDIFDAASTFTGSKHLDTAVFGGEYMIDLDDAVFVLPVSLTLSSGLASYQVSPFLSSIYNRGTLLSTAVKAESTVLIPSQSVEGGEPQVSMGNTDIIIWYLLAPMNSVTVGKKIEFVDILHGVLSKEIATPTLDR